ncbi:MAG: hypothetical protein WA432_03710 [Candidatus Babeliaceae bacterium]
MNKNRIFIVTTLFFLSLSAIRGMETESAVNNDNIKQLIDHANEAFSSKTESVLWQILNKLKLYYAADNYLSRFFFGHELQVIESLKPSFNKLDKELQKRLAKNIMNDFMSGFLQKLFVYKKLIFSENYRSKTINLVDIKSLAFNPQNSLFAAGLSNGAVTLWDLQAGQFIQNLSGHDDSVNSIVFSFDGTKLASGSADGSIKIWNVKNKMGDLLYTFAGDDRSIKSIVFNNDGTLLASGLSDGTINV